MDRAIDRIRGFHSPLVLKRMAEKAADYNSDGELSFEPHTVLGVKGQFADIWRKVWKLKKALWDGTKLNGEQPIEIIDDLIAHLFLTRDLITESSLQADLDSGALSLVQGESRDGDIGKVGVQFRTCGPECSPRQHSFRGQCRYRLAERDDA